MPKLPGSLNYEGRDKQVFDIPITGTLMHFSVPQDTSQWGVKKKKRMTD